ncbi:MAG TPA: ComF family protein [Candidatus Desulfofervidus auxilii]|uniref:ComF family protein n=1 Tax=Desulfofervidus auxilii TaxID=1621989 RepID=A0A7V0IAF1_DESA2|nr:ComF family protein [Candidatus Desulfofervidus auxilii]
MLLNVGLLQDKLLDLIDYFLPHLCPGCGKKVNRKEPFCAECRLSLRYITPPFCPICGKPFIIGSFSHVCGDCLENKPFFSALRAIFVYNDPIKKAIIQFKFQHNTALAPFFIKEILLHLKDFIESIKPDLILSVPLHIKRLRERGFNQSSLLAKGLAKAINVPYKQKILKKNKHTLPQVGLSLNERKKNVRGSFIIRKPEYIEYIKEKSILLLDDVCTTGSTVNECAKVLIKAGAKAVWVITLARTV